jgi:hypothetical protein
LYFANTDERKKPILANIGLSISSSPLELSRVQCEEGRLVHFVDEILSGDDVAQGRSGGGDGEGVAAVPSIREAEDVRTYLALDMERLSRKPEIRNDQGPQAAKNLADMSHGMLWRDVEIL